MKKRKPIISKAEFWITAVICLGILSTAVYQNRQDIKFTGSKMQTLAAAVDLEPLKVFQADPPAAKTISDFPYLQATPLHRGNARMKQPDSLQLDAMLSSDLFTTVVRLNGNGHDSGGLSIQQELLICRKYGVTFRYFNIEEKGALIQACAALLDGGTLVHCKHGYDRTGAVVGKAMRIMRMTHEEVVKHNRWENYIADKGEAYRKYLNMIL